MCVIDDVTDWVSVFDGLRLVVALSVLVVDGVFVGVRDRVEDDVIDELDVDDGVTVCVILFDCVSEAVGVTVEETDADLLGVREGERVREGVTDSEAVGVTVGETDTDLLGVREGERVRVGDGEVDGGMPIVPAKL